jgi:putative addiction module component (TIGR02574 family)
MSLSTIEAIKGATVYRRLEIVEEILTSIQDMEITKEFREELKKRKKEIIETPGRGRSWEQVRKTPRNTSSALAVGIFKSP